MKNLFQESHEMVFDVENKIFRRDTALEEN
jgi:hypothetical protein